MSLLISTEIQKAIYSELEEASTSVQIISAFCKKNAFENLLQHISDSVVKKRVLLRFRLDDLLNGSTDFGVLELCREKNWDVFVRFDLHAKTYIVDGKRGIIGSANATNKGLALVKNRNMEIATLTDINKSDEKKIKRLFSEAIKINDELFDKMKLQYNLAINRNDKNKKTNKWGKDIESLFNPEITTLFSYDFPETENSNINNVRQFLNLSTEVATEDAIEAFRWCRCNLWLRKVMKECDGEIYFGELSTLLHEAIVEDPKPYRKDIKRLLANQIKWLETLGIEDIVIDRPHYSQRLRLRG